MINEYILDTGTKSNTDWVLTFPTKNRYVTSAAAMSPFTNVLTTGGACETIGFGYFNREEAGAAAAGVRLLAAAPGWRSVVAVLGVDRHLDSQRLGAHADDHAASGVLGSANTTAITIRSTFQNGWANLVFAGTNATTVGMLSAAGVARRRTSSRHCDRWARQQFLGLPVVGFMVRTFNNGTLGAFQANYGSAFEHKYRQTIFPILP